MSYDKKAQDKYRDKTKPIAITVQYKTDDDKIEATRLKGYLQDNNLSANSYIKDLIKRDLDAKGIDY